MRPVSNRFPGCLLIITVGWLAGCDSNPPDAKKYAFQPMELESRPINVESGPINVSRNALVGPPTVRVPAPGAADDIMNEEPTGGDKAEKIELYYVLLGIARKGASGVDESNLDRILGDTQERANRVKFDRHQARIMDILHTLQEAMEARQFEEKMLRGGMTPQGVHWGSGALSVKARLQSRSGPAGINAPQALEQERLLNSVLDFESRYHSSPAAVRRAAFMKAESEAKQALIEFKSPDLGKIKGVKDASKSNPEPLDEIDDTR